MTKFGLVGIVLLTLSSAAIAEPRLVARVLSVEGATVTVQCVSGAIVNGDSVDVFTPEGKATATVKLPSNIDLVLTGDKIAGVSLVGARATAGAVATDPGHFASWAELTQALPSASSGAAAATPPSGASGGSAAPSAAGDRFRPSAEACSYSPADLSAALGFQVQAGTGTVFDFVGGAAYSCSYVASKGSWQVVLNRTEMRVGDPATNTAASRKMLAGRLELIANDPDGAGWQVDQGDLTDVTLHYWRGMKQVEFRVSGVNRKDAAAVADMRRRVLSLRRL